MNSVDVLRKYWKHESFRPLQEEIIQSVLAGRDTLALMPTGGGKSVCFQVPALMNAGICIVVTPPYRLDAGPGSGVEGQGDRGNRSIFRDDQT